MNHRFTFLLLPLLGLCSSLSLADVDGSYTTVSESECNEEIVFLSDATGKIINTCRLEDGSHKDEVKEVNVTWVLEGELISVHAGSELLTFSIVDSLSCSPFGRAGSSPSIIGHGKSYWKSPISCQ